MKIRTKQGKKKYVNKKRHKKGQKEMIENKQSARKYEQKKTIKIGRKGK
jgi:hypothetical protein